MAIGKRLKELLKEKKITVKQLSSITGISENTLYAIIKRDNKRINDDIAAKIVSALNIEVLDLIDTDNKLKYSEKNSFPGEIVLDINRDNFEKYKKYFIFVCKNIFDDFMNNYNVTITEQGYYDADTGEKKEITFDNPYEMFLELDDERKFLFLQEMVEKIIINPILNTYSFILKK